MCHKADDQRWALVPTSRRGAEASTSPPPRIPSFLYLHCSRSRDEGREARRQPARFAWWKNPIPVIGRLIVDFSPRPAACDFDGRARGQLIRRRCREGAALASLGIFDQRVSRVSSSRRRKGEGSSRAEDDDDNEAASARVDAARRRRPPPRTARASVPKAGPRPRPRPRPASTAHRRRPGGCGPYPPHGMYGPWFSRRTRRIFCFICWRTLDAHVATGFSIGSVFSVK